MLKVKTFFSFSIFFLVAFIFLASAEDITITTYYPSPEGVYNQLRTNTLAVGVSTSMPVTDGHARIRELDVIDALKHGGVLHLGWDIAEYIRTEDVSIESGDVVIVDPNHNQSIIKTSLEYDSTVLGVISTNPGDLGGVLKTSEGIFYTKEEMQQAGYRMLTLVGQVPCKVTTENGPIKRGDLLVTSSKPGYAMKADLNKIQIGMILGKALEPLESEEGKIAILVK